MLIFFVLVPIMASMVQPSPSVGASISSPSISVSWNEMAHNKNYWLTCFYKLVKLITLERWLFETVEAGSVQNNQIIFWRRSFFQIRGPHILVGFHYIPEWTMFKLHCPSCGFLQFSLYVFLFEISSAFYELSRLFWS